jgi:uncharacterized protein with PIN domain
MPQATIRFYEELNDFLPEDKRKKDFSVSFCQQSTVKDLPASLGVPHSEVDLILINGESVDFSFPLEGGERISVYPVFESLDIRSVRKLGPDSLRHLKFVADVHLGKLVKYLRLFGFDTLYDKGFDSHSLVEISARQGRVLVTRSRGLLKHKVITRGILVRETDPRMQLKSIFERLDLHAEARPFSRCLCCNGLVEPIPKQGVAAQSLPSRVMAKDQTFTSCNSRHRVYWEGTHFERMSHFVKEVLSKRGAPRSTAAPG